MEGKKVVLMILCQINLLGLIDGATYKTFASMTANASKSYPQVSTLQSSPNQVYYLSLVITNEGPSLGLQCYAVETIGTVLLRSWGGVKMISVFDFCSLVLDDRGFVALQSHIDVLNVYNLTKYQKAHMAEVQIYVQDDGSVVFLADSSSSTPSPSPSPTTTTTTSPSPSLPNSSPTTTTRNGPFLRSSACLDVPLSFSALFLLVICLFLQLPPYNA